MVVRKPRRLTNYKRVGGEPTSGYNPPRFLLGNRRDLAKPILQSR